MTTKAPTKKLYELVVILKPDINEDDSKKNISQIETAIKNYGGSIVKVEEPMRKKFAHRIKNYKDGFYVSVSFDSSPEVPNILKRTLSISDDILRYMVVTKEG